VHPQIPGDSPPGRLPRARRQSAARRSDPGRPGLSGRLSAVAHLPLVGLLARGMCLGVTLAAAIRYPTLIVVAAAAWLWVLWPAYAVSRRAGLVGTTGEGATARVRALPLWYAGGHPALPHAGRGRLRVWPEEGAALLQVGRSVIAFPLLAVQSVSLVEGRIELPTGCRGASARLVGRALAFGVGRFCGLRRVGRQDLAVIDRSRVVCDLTREGRSCRLVLLARGGGGEPIYLESLVMLRATGPWRDAGPSGGSRGAAASPQNGG